MSDDVTIPREDARKWADALRDAFDQLGGSAPLGLIGLADLLDPPEPSLRDEVIEAVRVAAEWSNYYGTGKVADAVLAVVRKRVLRLPRHKVFQRGWHVRLDDLIALFEEAR